MISQQPHAVQLPSCTSRIIITTEIPKQIRTALFSIPARIIILPYSKIKHSPPKSLVRHHPPASLLRLDLQIGFVFAAGLCHHKPVSFRSLSSLLFLLLIFLLNIFFFFSLLSPDNLASSSRAPPRASSFPLSSHLYEHPTFSFFLTSSSLSPSQPAQPPI